ncbi:MAG: alpha/beta hydrolase [Acidobacteriota bacterium]|nr:alpha/beta hydrolase [Acidobacteriota bacterium]
MCSAVVSPSESGTPESGRVRSFFLEGPAGRIEALLNEASLDARYAALVCHPHPVGGGTLHNKVVYHAMKAFNAPSFSHGWPVLRFNFRGTGLSEGVHDGAAEWEDVAAAIEWLITEYKLPIVTAGFSFGAAMMLKSCCKKQVGAGYVRGVVALGLPTQSRGSHYNYAYLSNCRLPKLFLSGDKDQYAPVDEWWRVTNHASDPKSQALIPGADHFFTGQLEAMQRALSGWLTERFQ